MTRPTKDELKARLKQLEGPLTEAIADREDALIERAELEADLREVEWRTGQSARNHSNARQAYDKARTIYLKNALARNEQSVAEKMNAVQQILREMNDIKAQITALAGILWTGPTAYDMSDAVADKLDAMMGGL